MIVVDPAKVRRVYSDKWLDWCQCDGCSNWRMVRERFLSQDFLQFMKSLGLALGDHLFQTFSFGGANLEESGLTRRKLYYIIPGQVLRGGTYPVRRFGASCYVSVAESLTAHENRSRQDHLADLSEHTLSIRVSAVVPWLFDEVRYFKSVQVADHCADCGQCWREIGRLKKTSRIPGWYGVDLGPRPHDYEVVLCWHCGRPEFRFAHKPGR